MVLAARRGHPQGIVVGGCRAAHQGEPVAYPAGREPAEPRLEALEPDTGRPPVLLGDDGRDHREQRQLLDNRLVSITAGAWEGALLATVAVGGAELELSTGAPGLAHVVGAPLLPVFTVRDEGTLRIAVIVGPPIEIDRAVERKMAVADAAQLFADRLAPFVDRYPLQWRDWEKLRRPSGPPA